MHRLIRQRASSSVSAPRLAILACSIGLLASLVSALAAQPQNVPTGDRQRVVRTLVDAGKYADADKAALALVEATEGTAGKDAMAVAEAIDLLLETRRRGSRSQGPETVALAERALRIKEATLDPFDPRLAVTLAELGNASRLARKRPQARPPLERALAIRERAFGAESLEVAASLQLLGVLAVDDRQLDQASEMFRRVIGIAERVAGPESELVAQGSYMLGVATEFQGNVEAAEPLHARAVAILERLRGPNHPDLSRPVERLAGVARALGDFEQARALWERSIRLVEQTLGPEDRLLYFKLIDLSVLLEHMGDETAAIAAGDRAIAIAEHVDGPESATVAAALNAVATVRRNLGDHDQARRLTERALGILTKLKGPSGEHLGEGLGNLAELAEADGRLEEALDLTTKAVAAFGNDVHDPRLLSGVLDTRGRILSQLGRAAEAREVLERGRRLNEGANNPEERIYLGATLKALAGVELRDGHPERALPLLGQTIEILEGYHGADSAPVAAARADYALALARSDKRAEAWTELGSAERIGLAHLRLTTRALPERLALRYAAERVSGVDLALTLATDAARATPEHIAAAWDLVIRARTVVLDEMAARQRTAALAADTPVAQERWNALALARTRLANLVVRGQGDDQLPNFQALLERRRAERDRAEQALTEVSRAFQQEQTRSRTGLADALGALPADGVLVAYLRYSAQQLRTTVGRAPDAPVPSYAAFVARRGSSPRLVPLGRASEIDALVADWRAQMRTALGSGGLGARSLEKSYRDTGAALRKRIWDPLAPHFGTATSAFVVPDAALHLVDIPTLPGAVAGYLVEERPLVHYLTAERDLVLPSPSQRTGTPALRAGTLLVVGAPDFDRTDASGAEARPAVSANAGMAGVQSRSPVVRRSACGERESQTFAPLTGSAREVESVARLWSGGSAGINNVPIATSSGAHDPRVVMLRGAEATETAFKQLAGGRRVLHLATHAFVLDETCAAGSRGSNLLESPLLRAGLALAGANRRQQAREDDDDGILTAEEIAGLDLSNTEWAVLSACDTGGGDWQRGEGVLGLRRAFHVAGAQTLIMSLWPVDDAVTARWMRQLYVERFVQGRTTAGAVRAASRRLLADRRAQGLSTHPIYWAGFIASGDWR